MSVKQDKIEYADPQSSNYQLSISGLEVPPTAKTNKRLRKPKTFLLQNHRCLQAKTTR